LTLSEYLKEQHGLLAELARQELADIGNFSTLIDSITENIADRVHRLDSTLLLLPGCAELTAAKLISEVANMDRFRSEAAFARYVGIAPVPLSSGSTGGRVRASRSGNRQCNAAIHRIAVVQMRLRGSGREYYLRRRNEGDTAATAIRCLKRRSVGLSTTGCAPTTTAAAPWSPAPDSMHCLPSNYDGASSPHATDATEPVTTGTAA
jgi:transposase